MQPKRLFAQLREMLSLQLAASGAEFGAVEIRHGVRRNEHTLIIFTNRSSLRCNFVPELMQGVDGTVDVRIGPDQIWIRADRPIRWRSKKMTSRQRNPLRVKVDVYQYGESQYDISVLLPLAMNVARLATVIDTENLFLTEERELPAMSMVSPLFEGLQSESPARHERKPTGIGSLVASLLAGIMGHGAEEKRHLPPGVHETDDELVIRGGSMEEVMEKLRRVQAAMPPDVLLVPTGMGVQHGDGRAMDDTSLLRFLRRLSPSQRAALEHNDCDTCGSRGKCPKEANTRAMRRLLGITPRSRRGGVTSDPWDFFADLGAALGHPSFGSSSRRDGHDERTIGREGPYDGRRFGHDAHEPHGAETASSPQPAAAETTNAGEEPAQETVAQAPETPANDTAAEMAEVPVGDTTGPTAE